MDRFIAHFGSLEDPRADNARHDLSEILFIALAAVLCGAKNCSDMAEWGAAKQALLSKILALPHGVPSHDTFARIFRILEPKAFEAAFRAFMAAFSEAAQIKASKGVVALDGKALRRAYDRGASHMPRVMVSAWAAEAGMTLSSLSAPDGNEAAAALQVIELLQLKGRVVTADALHCHRAMAKAIGARGGAYAIAVKGNQPALLREAEAALEAAGETAPMTTRTDRAHGRVETRMAVVAPAPSMAERHDFPGLSAVARVESQRDGDAPVRRTFLLSEAFAPDQLLDIIRTHWSIENTLHWTLDVAMDEDAARNRKDNAPANLAVLRRLALNVARAHPDKKTSLRRKLLRAGWDDAFFFELVRHMR